MGKLEDNKKRKKEALFHTAFDLFTTKGINKTAVSDIVDRAGVAKGTFYLYFKDKYDIRNKLITHKANELFGMACASVEKAALNDFEDKVIYIVDFIIDQLTQNPPLMNFIAKNLSWGVFKTALSQPADEDGSIFCDKFMEMIQKDSHHYDRPDIMLFTIVELTSATCFPTILEASPVTIGEFKPYLHRAIRAILHANWVHELGEGD